MSEADSANALRELYAREGPRDLDAPKVIKVKLPVRFHVQLHAMKLLGDRNISETVEAALHFYFERMRLQELAARGALSETTPGGFPAEPQPAAPPG